MDRRAFVRMVTTVSGAMVASPIIGACSRAAEIVGGVPTELAHPTAPSPTNTPQSSTQPSPEPAPTRAVPPQAPGRVAFVRTDDRAFGVRRALELLEFNPVQAKDIFLKPNFNSADPAPGSTHNDTLLALVESLRSMGVGGITLGDRSGMGDTRAVMQRKEIFHMAEEVGFSTVVFDDLGPEDWVYFQPDGTHWSQGFAVARPALAADGLVQACCLKTHRYGGHFTLSLKNSVGLAAKLVSGDRHDYMRELHNSPHQRRMIAEINLAYQPDLIVLDGVEAFVDGGPARGTLVSPQVVLAGSDRVAIDAVGVALLRYFGTTRAVAGGAIFEQEQIARAVELGLGVQGPQQIELVTGDPESAAFAAQIREVLDRG